MNYPGGNRQIDILEENNRSILSIKVFEEFEFDGNTSMAIYRRTKIHNAKYHINLLKITDEDCKCHLVYVKDYNRLSGSQTHGCKIRFYDCPYCQHGFKHESTYRNI